VSSRSRRMTASCCSFERMPSPAYRTRRHRATRVAWTRAALSGRHLAYDQRRNSCEVCQNTNES
jgi:hypothetical protein